MNIKKQKQSILSIPITNIKCLYKNNRTQKIICELDIKSLKPINKASTIDEIIVEAELEYHSGKTKSFKNTKKMLTYLNS